MHSPPAPSRIGQQLALIAHLTGSWTAMAECTDVGTIRAGPANRRCEQRYRDQSVSLQGKICAETRLCLFVIVFSPLFLFLLLFLSCCSFSFLSFLFFLPMIGSSCLPTGASHPPSYSSYRGRGAYSSSIETPSHRESTPGSSHRCATCTSSDESRINRYASSTAQ